MMAHEKEHKGERVAKYLARAGYGSRREMEAVILEGRVSVNGTRLSSPALNVTDQDKIAVDGNMIGAMERARLFLYHKPRGLVVSRKDEKGRATIFDHLPQSLPRLISIGRLDMDSEGLLLLTNDGAIARHYEHPDQQYKRQYRARIFGKMPHDFAQKLADGITIEGVQYRPITLDHFIHSKDDQAYKNHWISLSLIEGKNREIRKVMEYFDLKVNRLIRESFGPYHLGKLPSNHIMEVENHSLK